MATGHSDQLKGLVLEGGAMRGMFTAGVLDVFMEHGVRFDGTVGVSAGAVFGCNFKSKQIGRVIRYSKRFARDPRYAGMRSWLTTGDLYNRDFCYHTVPRELDVFDEKAFREDPMEFIAVTTDIETGEPLYTVCERGDEEDLEWMRASASMPLFARPVRIGKRLLLDGGTADSIPLRFMEQRGYERIVAVLTQPEDYRKGPSKLMPLFRIALRKYPNLIKTIEDRWIMYNDAVEYVRQRERDGAVFVIRPEHHLNIGRMERDPEKLKAVYQIGRATAEKQLSAMIEYLNG